MTTDIAAYTEDQALAEMERLDALARKRTLTDAEHRRLVLVEERLEQFVAPEVLQRQGEAAAKAARGEQIDFGPEITSEEIAQAKARGQWTEAGAELGERGVNGFAILAGTLFVGALWYVASKR